jgi:negative regulator of flagellin synthesis FlgM
MVTPKINNRVTTIGHMGATRMKISNQESLNASQIGSVTPASGIAGSAQMPAQTQDSAVATPAAEVQLSSQAQALASAKAAVDAAPDTRDDLVANLKSQIDAGTYSVSGKDIAEQMLRRVQADNLR